jgi:gliding motility-associated-like protein
VRTTSKVSVLVLTQPTAAFSVKSSGCTNELILFTNQSTTDPQATPVYSWNFDDTNTDNVSSPTHSYSTPKTYLPSLNVQYSGVTGCTSSINKSIVIATSNPPTIVADPPSICPQQNSTLSITGTYTSILWSDGNTGLSTSVNSAGDYTLTALDANSCTVTAEITVLSNQVPDVQISSDVQNLAPGAKAQLQATGADTYVWAPAETLSDPTISNPIASPVTTTTYTVVGSLTGGCSASKEIIITVNGSSLNIKVPPAFSPNGDQSNDILDIDGILNYPNCVLTIYDGRGRRIFQARGDGDKWDGNYQGRPVPEGTYYFVFACPSGKPLTGNILVFR